MKPRFPAGAWGRRRLTFLPAPARPPLRPFAAMVFAWRDGCALLCEIPGRGWCVPSGRIEPGEEPARAAEREAYEEGGARISDIRYLGCFQIRDGKTTVWAEAFAARVDELLDIPPGSEATGRRLVAAPDLPGRYYMWDSLTEAVFGHARSVLER